MSVKEKAPELGFTGPIQPHTYRKVEADPEPGPGHYTGDVMAVGKPALVSTARTVPAFGFTKSAKLQDPHPKSGCDYVAHDEPGRGSPMHKIGTATRDAYKKAYIHEFGHSATNAITTKADFLGAEQTTSLGSMVESRRKTSPRFSFSKTARMTMPKEGFLTARTEFVSPDHGSVASRAVVSTKHNAPLVKFGSEKRPDPLAKPAVDATTLDTTQATSIGRMVDSKKTTLPSWKIGTSPRLEMPKHVLTTRAVEFVSTEGRTMASPSPVLRTAPSFGFGSATREVHQKTGTLREP